MLTVDPQNNIEITRGDGEPITFSVVDSAGVALNVSGWSFAFTVKESIDDDIADAIFQKTSAAGAITIQPGGVTGKVVVQLADADTQAIDGKHEYDLQGYDGTYTHTPAKGRFWVRKDVTTPGSAGQPTPPTIVFPGGMFAIGSDGSIYFKDVTTLLWQGFKVNAGNFEQAAAQSATIPYSF